MKQVFRKERNIGLALIAANLILGRFTAMPEFALGILLGLGLAFLLIGSLPAKAYNGLKSWKNSIRRRLMYQLRSKIGSQKHASDTEVGQESYPLTRSPHGSIMRPNPQWLGWPRD